MLEWSLFRKVRFTEEEDCQNTTLTGHESLCTKIIKARFIEES